MTEPMRLTLLERWLIRRIAKRRVLERALIQARTDRDEWRARLDTARQDTERLRRELRGLRA